MRGEVGGAQAAWRTAEGEGRTPETGYRVWIVHGEEESFVDAGGLGGPHSFI